jgi:hypothetical protein
VGRRRHDPCHGELGLLDHGGGKADQAISSSSVENDNACRLYHWRHGSTHLESG